MKIHVILKALNSVGATMTNKQLHELHFDASSAFVTMQTLDAHPNPEEIGYNYYWLLWDTATQSSELLGSIIRED